MPTVSNIVDVAVALPIFGTFCYTVPAELRNRISIGKRALVPFGSRKVTGYVLGEGKKPDGITIKAIEDILDEQSLFPPEMIVFYKWISTYYLAPLGEVIKNALPGGLNLFEAKMVTICHLGKSALLSNRTTPSETAVLRGIEKKPQILGRVLERMGKKATGSVIRSMEKKNWLKIEKKMTGKTVGTKKETFVFRKSFDAISLNLSEPRIKILNALANQDNVSLRSLKKKIPTAPSLVRNMKKDGQVGTLLMPVYRDPFGDPIEPDTPPELTKDQNLVVSSIRRFIGNSFAAFLLAGVTGSGKTEVYLRLTETALNMNRCVLVLVPEIALISQTERRFRARFGERVAVLHSGLSKGERFDQWNRIRESKIPLVIGARSAIFAPLKNLGLIIVDEEHDTSYKQEGALKYNARDLAIVRARQNNAVAVLGSATPSMQSLRNVETGKLSLTLLNRRVMGRLLPDIEVVDLCRIRDEKGPRRFISERLLTELKSTLDRKEQALLFLNRRGFAAFPTCTACGEPLHCKNCDITLTLHKKINGFKCHYCGYTRSSASRCQACGSARIKLLGLGTERLEEDIRSLFPQARIARMDRDTTTRKGAVLKILKKLKEKKIDILIGTQMVAKGHDFPGITLVGIVCADLTLNFPDFRSGERTFQLLAQVAGRAGRGNTPGRVILQTYNPQHFSIVSARDQDFRQFYEKEAGFRKALGYPPFTRMIQIRISGKNSVKTADHASFLGQRAIHLTTSIKRFSQQVNVMGPIEAPLSKIANRYRWQMLIRGKNSAFLHEFTKTLLFEPTVLKQKGNIRVDIDVDPIFLM